MKKTYKNILVDVRGGTGKNIAFSHILPELKEKYEIVSVISPYKDVFEASEYCDKAYSPNEVKAAIEDAADDTLIVIDHIYDTNEFIRKEISYQDAFRKLCGIDTKDGLNGSTAKSNLDSNRFPMLKGQADQVVDTIKKNGFDDFILLQHTGGQSPLVQVPVEVRKNEKTGKDEQVQAWDKVQYNGQNAGLSRHYPEDKTSEFVKKFRMEHPKTAVIDYGLPNEPAIDGTFRFIIPYLAYLDLAKREECKGAICIDSSLQHLLAGVTKCVVLWHHTLPTSFGYSYNKNIIANCNRSGIKYFSALGPASNRIDYVKPDELLKEVNKYLFDTDTKKEEK